jgi:hypothetical protein
MRRYAEYGSGLCYVDEREISSLYREKNQDSSGRPARGMITILPELSWLQRRWGLETERLNI